MAGRRFSASAGGTGGTVRIHNGRMPRRLRITLDGRGTDIRRGDVARFCDLMMAWLAEHERPPPDECAKCGKPRDHRRHMKYGNDVEGVKHWFEERPGRGKKKG